MSSGVGVEAAVGEARGCGCADGCVRVTAAAADGARTVSDALAVTLAANEDAAAPARGSAETCDKADEWGDDGVIGVADTGCAWGVRTTIAAASAAGGKADAAESDAVVSLRSNRGEKTMIMSELKTHATPSSRTYVKRDVKRVSRRLRT